MTRAAVSCSGSNSLRSRGGARLLIAALMCVTAGLTAVCRAATSDEHDDDDAATPWYEGTTSNHEADRESWAGAEAFRRVWSLYSGSTYAPFSNLRQEGLRLRTVSAFSAYSYAGRRFDAASGGALWQTFRGQARTVDVLAGYQVRSGDLTVKLFAGYQNTAIAISPFDPETIVQGQRHGFKGALEVWYNITPRNWIAADLTAATAFGSYSHRMRVADRMFEHVSLGIEAAAFGHKEAATYRAGTFLRFDNGTHEVSVSAGWSMPRGDSGHAYGTAQWLYRF